MKQLSELSWNVSEEEYRKDKAISYSTLSKYVKEGFRALYDTTAIETDSLRFGSLVDCLLTEPETFEDRFLLVDFKIPSSLIVSIVTKAYETFKVPSIYAIDRKDLLTIIDEFEYYPNWLADTRINKIIIQGENYYKLLADKRDRIIISENELKAADNCVYELLTNSFTKPFMAGTNDPQMEHLYQVKFKLEGEFNVRCMFDKIIVDHVRKVIIPIDLKTSSLPEEQFVTAFWKWKYYIQASLYKYILETVCSQDDYFKDFTIQPFKFVVINKETLSPIVWEFDNEVVFYETRNVKPWNILYKEVKYYLDNPISKYSKETLDSYGIRQINSIELDVEQLLNVSDESII